MSLALLATGCKKKRRAGPPAGGIQVLLPAGKAQAVVLRVTKKRRRVATLEHASNGVRWTRTIRFPVAGSGTIGAGFFTYRYGEMGVEREHMDVEYGVEARSTKNGLLRWRYRAAKGMTSRSWMGGFSRRAGAQLFERFEDEKGRSHVIALDLRKGRKLWSYAFPKGQTPFILAVTKQVIVLVALGRRGVVLRRSDGKALLAYGIDPFSALGSCVVGGRLYYFDGKALHAVGLSPFRDAVINPAFFGDAFRYKFDLCGSYRGQLFAVTTVDKKTEVVGLTRTGKPAWRIALGPFKPDLIGHRSYPSGAPLNGAQPRFVPFVATNAERVLEPRRLFIVDLDKRRVAYRGVGRKRLLNWRWQGRSRKHWFFSRFNEVAAFELATGKLRAGFRCRGKAVSTVAAFPNQVWLCGEDKDYPRWSLRDVTTLAPVPGKFNLQKVSDIRAELVKFFGLKSP